MQRGRVWPLPVASGLTWEDDDLDCGFSRFRMMGGDGKMSAGRELRARRAANTRRNNSAAFLSARCPPSYSLRHALWRFPQRQALHHNLHLRPDRMNSGASPGFLPEPFPSLGSARWITSLVHVRCRPHPQGRNWALSHAKRMGGLHRHGDGRR